MGARLGGKRDAGDELLAILAAAHQRLDERDAKREGEGSPVSPPLTPSKILMRHLRSVS